MKSEERSVIKAGSRALLRLQLLLIICGRIATAHSVTEDLREVCVGAELLGKFPDPTREPLLNTNQSYKVHDSIIGQPVCSFEQQEDYDPRRIPTRILHVKCASSDALLPGRCLTQTVRVPVLNSVHRTVSWVDDSDAKLLVYKKAYIDWAIDCAFVSNSNC
ncbi:hypothetical protein BOX15_Mlig017262g1 [Macrostomum lignano]|uniref:Uncharacterized protein n=1 Tax=Macrostomum lignano TaxID=282301 RepID=A0A267DZE3_9PLAT|nr:hypothetical protein BOX15_Mlig017262g1 [Macrostomum lignano]